MSALLITVASVSVGAVVTVMISRCYYRRSIDKGPTPYIKSWTSVFRGVEPHLREALKISYDGVPVTDLLEVQFLIANTGYRPIRDVIEPLTLRIPEGCQLLDASLIYVYPEGRGVKVDMQEEVVVFRCPLLNANEFFICKLLLKGEPGPRDFVFRISAEDLPPIIKPMYLGRDRAETGEKRKVDLEMFALGAHFSIVGAAVTSLMSFQLSVMEDVWQNLSVAVFRESWLILGSLLFATIPAVMCLVIGRMLLLGSFTNLSFPSRKRFEVPPSLIENSSVTELRRLERVYLEEGT